MHLKSLNSALHVRLSLVVAFTCAPLLSLAQLGVSPSQNAAFLTELRARDPKRAEENQDVLGDDREKLEAGRALSRPGIFTQSIVRNTRLSADITGFPSQYQLGRSYLSPWYDGILAPETSIETASGLKAGFALDQRIEYNTGFGDDPVGIIGSALLFDGSYKIAANQRLTFSGGIGFNWYTSSGHIDWSYFSDELGLTILPGTSIAYDVQFGPVSMTFYDRVSTRTYLGVLQNDLGAALTWQIIPDLSWTLNYTRTITEDIDGPYPGGAYVDFDLDTFSSLLNYEINPSLAAGVEGALSWLNHGDGFYGNDGKLWSLGLYANWKITESARLRVAVGYQHQTFKNTKLGYNSIPILPDSVEQLSEPYYSLSFSQRLTSWLSHELAVGYESNLDFSADFNTAHYANYGVTGSPWKGGQVTASAYVEVVDESDAQYKGATATAGGGKNCGLDLHVSQKLTPRLDVGFGYSYAYREVEPSREIFSPSSPNYNWDQHMTGVNLGFAVSTKVHLNLAYQTFFFNFSGPGPIEDTHRVILGVRVQF